MFNIYATDYAPVDPITPPCDIVPIFIGYKGENKARCLVFDLTECVSTFGDGGFVISFIRQGDELPYLVTNTDRLDNNAIWIINSTDTAVDGYGMVQLQYIVDDVICKSALYRTVTFDSNGINGDVPDPYEDLLAQIAAYAATAEGAATTATAAANTATTAVENGIVTERSQRIAADNGLQQQITNLMGLAGAPVMANTAAAMTDSSKIYIYTGSEAGYVFGNWYYFNGAEWVSGGVYQASAVETDKTLSVENMAADAAACGDLKRQIYSAFVEESASGNIASFDDGADDVPLKDLVVNITPKQASGTPSPTNVLPITGWTAANVGVCGHNALKPVSPFTQVVNGLTITLNADGSVTANGTATANTVILIGTLELCIGKTYVMTGATATYKTFQLTDYPVTTNKGVISPSGMTFTADITNYAVRTYFYNGQTFSNETFYPMIRFADDTDSTWSEYVDSTTYNISFGSAGTVYGGTLDVTSGMLTVTWKQFTFDGSETWGYRDYGSSLGGYKFYSTIGELEAPGRTNYTVGKFVCNEFVPMAFNYQSQVNSISMGGVSGTADGVFVRKDDITSVADFKTWLASNPLIVVVNVATPISYQLTPTEVRTLLANNNIWSDTGSVESCEYRADTGILITKLTNAIISLGGNV